MDIGAVSSAILQKLFEIGLPGAAGKVGGTVNRTAFRGKTNKLPPLLVTPR